MRLNRTFRIMDGDGSRGLTMSRFTKAMLECGLELSIDEVKELFAFFDRNGSGEINSTELLAAIKVGKAHACLLPPAQYSCRTGRNESATSRNRTNRLRRDGLEPDGPHRRG
jgi:Ca2+-binding EF-hand superfamily protein